MKKPTFDEVVAGLEIEYPKGPIFRSYSSLSAIEAVEILRAIDELMEDGEPYEIVFAFNSILPVDKKSRKMVSKMTLEELGPYVREWINDNMDKE
jgi:hypothetical protein